MSKRRWYVIYEEDTGTITKSMFTRDPENQCQLGEKFVEGRFDDRFNRVVAGEVKEIPGARAAHDAWVAAQKRISQDRAASREARWARLRELSGHVPEAVQILLDLELERAE
jgi:hypothetical protein